ncbi:hypothetical protein HWV62_24750 [Athelia sp. TMB]|nr:hypothetical protein HWV62_24750 [Athelia sp. TMB]
MVPTLEEVEYYLASIEELLWSATPDLPNLHEAVNRLWVDISRFGPQNLPSLQDVHAAGMKAFEVPAPPPPPPPPRSWIERSASWAGTHRWTVGGIVVGVGAIGLFAGYTLKHRHVRSRRAKAANTPHSERRQVIVVLGGDHPLAAALIKDLEDKGYIIITSVATLEAAEALESTTHGYVRALILDPSEPGTVPAFLRSLASTLSRRFPINVAGDPYASPSSHPYIHSVISLLSLSTSLVPAAPTPFEQLEVDNTYMPYLTATHITPIRVIQALLPLLRSSPARARDAASNFRGSRSIIVCVPATDARVGLPFSSAQAMSAAATLRGLDVLRREINVAALTDSTESMKNMKVVVVDVGAVGSTVERAFAQQDLYKAMEDWTPSEKVAYGPAFSSVMEQPSARRPADVSDFVNSLVQVVSGGRKGGVWPFTLGLGLGRFRNWVRGERFAVGAGARTYTLASHLPSSMLDILLSLPQLLISVRNRLLPVIPAITQPYPPPQQPAAPPVIPATALVVPEPTAPTVGKAPSEPEVTIEELSDHDISSDTGSEADVESGGENVESSWIKA